MLYQDRSFEILKYITGLIPGSLGSVKFYERIANDETAEVSERSGWKGKMMVEVNAYDSWLEAPDDPANHGRPVNSVALWVQGQRVYHDEYPTAWYDFDSGIDLSKRSLDLSGESPCPDEC